MANRIPSLDGLRAISIVAVLLGHLSGSVGFFTLDLPLDYSNLGVRIFFVISGFLITGLLMREMLETGRVSLKEFYFRRTIRIFPAYYAFILLVWFFSTVDSRLVLSRLDLIHAATYTTNYHSIRGWNLGHAWSLAVEEQFYLIWPLVFALFRSRVSLWVACFWLVLAPLARGLLLALPDGTSFLQQNVGFSFETVSDAIATGCLLALVRQKAWSFGPYRAVLESRFFFLVPLLGLVSASLGGLKAYVSPTTDWWLTAAFQLVGLTVVNVCIALIIDWCIRSKETVVYAMLNGRFIVYLGGLSYSLYLWQQLFLNRGSTAWYAAFPQNLVLAFVAALLSHRFIEQPFLRLRARHASRLNANTPSG